MFKLKEFVLDVARRGMRERSAMSRYGAALGFTLAAFALKAALEQFIEQESPFLLFFSAVMFSAWFGGLGAGLLATLLSALLSDYFFLAPSLTLRPGGSGQALRLVIFIIEGAGISLLCEGLRTSRLRGEAQESALRESEARHRMFVEEVADYAFMIFDANGIITDWNYGGNAYSVIPNNKHWDKTYRLSLRRKIARRARRNTNSKRHGKTIRQRIYAGICGATVRACGSTARSRECAMKPESCAGLRKSRAMKRCGAKPKNACATIKNSCV